MASNDRHGHALEVLPRSRLVAIVKSLSATKSEASRATLAIRRGVFSANMTEEERAGSLPPLQAGRIARGDQRCRRPDWANFASWAIVIFTFAWFTFFGKPSTTARVDKQGGGASSAAAAAGFQVGDVVTDIDGKTIGSFLDMQRIVGVRLPASNSSFTNVKRGDTHRVAARHPEMREVKDPFGNVHRLGVLGITRSTAPGDVLTERGRSRHPRSGLGVKETWFVVDRTLAYIGEASSPAVRPPTRSAGRLRIACISGQVATIGLAALIHSGCGTLDLGSAC